MEDVVPAVPVPSYAGPRGELLRPYDVLGREALPDLQALVEVAVAACGVPTGVINLIDDDYQWQVAAVGLERSVCRREDSLCNVAIVEPAPVIVPDLREDARFVTNPFVTGEIDLLRFYASSQLRSSSGEVFGTLCVFDDKPRELSTAAARALDALAQQVVHALELRRHALQLEQAVGDLTRARADLHASNARLKDFTGDVSHQLRGPLTSLRLRLDLALMTAGAGGPVEDDLRGALEEVVRLESTVADLLAFAREERREVDLADAHGIAAAAVERWRPQATLRSRSIQLVTPDGGDALVPNSLASQILDVLVDNALKHGRGDIALSVFSADEFVRLQVRDDGDGVAPDIAGRLFDRRLAQASAAGEGIGLALSAQLAAAAGGRVIALPGAPTTFELVLATN